MDLDPEEKGWTARHSVITTIIILFIIGIVGGTLKMLQPVYFPAEEQEFETPVFLNSSFQEVDSYLNLDSNMTEEQKEVFFEENYKYNVFKWNCRPISCTEILGAPTLKMVCKERGFTEDLRVAMKEDCSGVATEPELTVVFQLMSRTTGEYYLGRSGRIVENEE